MGDGVGVWEVHSGSPEETQRLAGRLAARLRGGDVLCLSGRLGAGKTCFVQGLAAGLGVGSAVRSPTFTLVHEYRGRLPVYHIDAYRLTGPEDLEDIGGDEYLCGDGVTVIEWAERVRPLVPAAHLWITLAIPADDPDRRRILRLEPAGDRMTALAAQLTRGGRG